MSVRVPKELLMISVCGAVLVVGTAFFAMAATLTLFLWWLAAVTSLGAMLFALAGVAWLNSRDRHGGHPDYHLTGKVTALFWLFAQASLAWALFYVVILFDPTFHVPSSAPLPMIGFAENFLTNVTSLFLMRFYIELSAISHRHRSEGHSLRSDVWSWTFLLGTLMVFEFLARATSPHSSFPSVKGVQVLSTLYGLAQAVAIYLLAGRLDSVTISRHLLMGWRSTFHRASIGAAYCYASIQPLYVIVGANHPKTTILLFSTALVLKIWLMLWLYTLLTCRIGLRLTPLEYMSYETERFAAEEGSEFERTFLHRHFRPIFIKDHRERKIGYLGIEYSYLNDYKRHCLGLRDAEGGLLVKRVYAGSAAMKEGVRPWDLVVSVNGMPVGLENTLSEVLEGTAAYGIVDVDLLRKINIGRCASSKMDYSTHHFRVMLGDVSRMLEPRALSWSRLGCKVRGTSYQGGALCYWEKPVIAEDGVVLPANLDTRITAIRSTLSGRWYEVPDATMFRLALEQVVAGDTITLLDDGKQLARVVAKPETLEPAPPKTGPSRKWVELGPTDGEVTKRLIKFYPDRLASRAELQPGVASQNTGMSYLMFFDSNLALLFECCGCYSKVEDVSGFKLWNGLGAGPVHVFRGVLPNSGRADDLRLGQFLTYDFSEQIA